MTVELDVLLLTILVGLAAGYLAGVVLKGRGFGLLGNIVVGVVGAVLGSFLLKSVGIVIAGGLLGALINAFIGAVVFLLLLAFVRREL